jgi:hypothetical protein
MRLKNKIGIGMLIISVILLGTLVTRVIINNQKTPTYEETKCYDRYNNEIKGLICLDEVGDNFNTIDIIILVSWLLFTIIGIGVLESR